MANERWLKWDGCTNVRDLGGLPTRDGRMTRRGALVRSDHPAKLSAAGWSALVDYGIGTIIRLATDGTPEEVADAAPRPDSLVTVRCAIEDLSDAAFVERWVNTDLWCTPLYYQDALTRWPQRHIAVVEAFARARPSGVLIHCKRGNDRTGIMSLLLLMLAGVEPEAILADYELSADEDREFMLAREQTTVRDVILNLVTHFDVESYLRAGGLSEADLTAARARLLDI